MTSRVQVIGLDHIVLRVADVERSVAFYVDELGLEPERLDEWRRGEVLFPSVRVTPTTIIDLFAAERDGQNMAHVCLVIAPTAPDALRAAHPGSTKADGLFGAPGYATSVYIKDPDGNTVELR